MNSNSFLFINKLNGYDLRELSRIYENKKDLIVLVKSIFNIEKDQIYKKNILIKPNWVRHPMKPSDYICLTTHPNIIFATLELLLEYMPKKITIGDAPIQGCQWDKMIPKNFFEKVNEYSKAYSVPIYVKDFRRTTLDKGRNIVTKDRAPIDNYIIFNLGFNSFLEPISSDKPIFRVTDYDPQRLARSHKTGVHKYCITKELFNADVVISLPKVKTHQKTGITCALKNIVGFNGDKDFLPHHRVGGTDFGGDCYPGKNYLRRFSEYLKDVANKNIGESKYLFWNAASKIFWRLNKQTKMHSQAAAWYGNDTTWRMVADLNNIVRYGNGDGSISNTPQREIYSLSDGIIAGQGDGPLNPVPLPLGVVAFTNDSALNDAAMVYMMGFDINKIPLVRECLKSTDSARSILKLNNEPLDLKKLLNYSLKTTPPPGWMGFIEYDYTK